MFIVVIARFWNLPLRELPLENVPDQLTARVAGIAGTSVDAPPPGVVRGMRHETKPMEPAPHPRRRRWWLIAIAVLVLLGVATKFYTAYGHAEPVPFYRISLKSTLQVTGPGLLDATNRVVISAQIEGRLASLKVVRGDFVQLGVALATIEADEIGTRPFLLKYNAMPPDIPFRDAESTRNFF
jgi:hypothetical protein